MTRILTTIKETNRNIIWNRSAILTSDKRQVSELTNYIVFGAEWVHNGLVPVASKALNDYLVRRRSYFNKVLSGFEQFFYYKIWQNIYINSYMPTLPAHTQLSSSRSEIYLKLAPHLSIDLGTDFSPARDVGICAGQSTASKRVPRGSGNKSICLKYHIQERKLSITST